MEENYDDFHDADGRESNQMDAKKKILIKNHNLFLNIVIVGAIVFKLSTMTKEDYSELKDNYFMPRFKPIWKYEAGDKEEGTE